MSQRLPSIIVEHSDNEDAIASDESSVTDMRPRAGSHVAPRSSNARSSQDDNKPPFTAPRSARRRTSSNAVSFSMRLAKITSKVSSDGHSRHTRSSVSSESSVDSHASGGSSQDTEEDVCFPMHDTHVRVDDVDVSAIEQFIEEERLENELLGRREQLLRQVNSDESTPMPVSSSDGSRKGSTTTTNTTTASSGTYNNEVIVPERFSFFNSAWQETIHAPNVSTLLPDGGHVRDMFEPEDSVWWLDCTCPTDDEMKMMARAYGIHPLTAEDIRTQEPREKVEVFKTYYFVTFHTFEDDPESEDYLERINVYMIVFRKGLLTFHFSPISNPTNVRRRMRQLRDYVDVSADWLCYAMIDDITDGFAPVINSIEYEAESIEDTMFLLREEDFRMMLYRIGEVRRKVMTMMRLLQGKADVIKTFAKRCHGYGDKQTLQLSSNIALYLGDIQDHILTMFQSLLSYEKILSRAHTNYLSLLQVESFYYNNDVMDMVSKVAFLSAIIVPMNLFTGLFSMNVNKIPGGDVENYGWFGGILGFIVFLIVMILAIGEAYMMYLDRISQLPAIGSVKGYMRAKPHQDDDRPSLGSLPTRLSRYWK